MCCVLTMNEETKNTSNGEHAQRLAQKKIMNEDVLTAHGQKSLNTHVF